ncbi:MAG: hypothetical protein ABEJ99_01320 [Candidatus Nanohaloarchaea archaeon]
MTLETNKSKAAAITAVLVVLVAVAATAVNGFVLRESEGRYHKTVITCHGLPLDGCIGKTSEDKVFSDINQTERTALADRCQKLKGGICSTPDIPNETWKSTAQAYGLSCGQWEKAYNLDLGTC